MSTACAGSGSTSSLRSSPGCSSSMRRAAGGPCPSGAVSKLSGSELRLEVIRLGELCSALSGDRWEPWSKAVADEVTARRNDRAELKDASAIDEVLDILAK